MPTVFARGLALLLWCVGVAAQAGEQLTFLLAKGAAEPYQIVDTSPARVHSGIFTDLLTRILRDSGAELVPVVRPYKRIKLELLAQRYPYWISYGSPIWLDERLHALGEYSDAPVLQTRYTLTRLATLVPKELRLSKVIVIHGYSYYPSFYRWVDAHNIELVQAPTHRHALAMLKQHRGDYYVAEELRVRWHAQRMDIPLSDLVMLDFSNVIPPSVVYLLLDKRIAPATRTLINKRLHELEQSGELAQILARYQ